MRAAASDCRDAHAVFGAYGECGMTRVREAAARTEAEEIVRGVEEAQFGAIPRDYLFGRALRVGLGRREAPAKRTGLPRPRNS